MTKNNAESKQAENYIKVHLTSSGLPDDHVETINRALQRALLAELANIRIEPTAHMRLEKQVPTDRLRGGESTDGIWVEISD